MALGWNTRVFLRRDFDFSFTGSRRTLFFAMTSILLENGLNLGRQKARGAAATKFFGGLLFGQRPPVGIFPGGLRPGRARFKLFRFRCQAASASMRTGTY